MFAAAFWQERDDRLVIVGDRLGIKPLYYALHRGDLHFGSELKAIFEHPEIPRHLCETALSYYLSLNYVPSPYTLVEGVEKLTPGTWMEWRRGEIRRGTYWRNEIKPEEIPLEEAAHELDDLLSKAIIGTSYFRCATRYLGKRRFRLFDNPALRRRGFVAQAGNILHFVCRTALRRKPIFSSPGQTLQHCPPRVRFKRRGRSNGAIHQMAYYSDEPSADAGALPVWFLSQMTAKHVTVALSGEGADEIFGGYQTYLADRYASWARRVPNFVLRAGLRAADKIPASDEKIGFDYKVKRFLGVRYCLPTRRTSTGTEHFLMRKKRNSLQRFPTNLPHNCARYFRDFQLAPT